MFKLSSTLLSGGTILRLLQNYKYRPLLMERYYGQLNNKKIDLNFTYEKNESFYNQFNLKCDLDKYFESAYRHRGILIPIKNSNGEWMWHPQTHSPEDYYRNNLPFYERIPNIYLTDIKQKRYINVAGFHSKVKLQVQEETIILKPVPESIDNLIDEYGLEKVCEIIYNNNPSPNQLDMDNFILIHNTSLFKKEIEINLNKFDI